MAGNQGRADFSGDAGDATDARHGYVEPFDAHDWNAYAGDAYAKADGGAERSKGREVRPSVLDRDDSAPQGRLSYGEGDVRHCWRRAGCRTVQFRDRCR